MVKYEGWNVGQSIRRLRHENKMTIEQLSEAVGKSVSHITQLEEGRRKMSIDLLYELLTVFETDANNILALKHDKDNSVVTNSVDLELSKLNPMMKNYLENQFISMIRNAPGQTMC